ncbi:hypothetical protein F4805DRAFT_454946 [Annulohypoxylon moriforme]|nr:hypothetical protein F4805DRAFT_454946 [Annulohypoxylon moriforme]
MAVSGSTSIIILCSCLIPLSILAVGLRFKARVIQKAGFGIDDYLIVLGLVFLIGFGVTSIVAAARGNLGNHLPLNEDGLPMSNETLIIFAQTIYATQLIHMFGGLFIKSSITCFYRRIFRGEIFNIVTITLLVIIVCWAISIFLATLLQCLPIDNVWLSVSGSPERAAHCVNVVPLFYAMAISNLILDVFVLVVPIPMVWKLQMARSRKIAVSGIFLLGSFATAAAAVRVYFFFEVGKGVGSQFDVTYYQAPTIYWTFVEQTVAVICACLPTLHILYARSSLARPLRRAFKKFTSISGGGSSSKRKQSLDRDSVEGLGKPLSGRRLRDHVEPYDHSSLELGSVREWSSRNI